MSSLQSAHEKISSGGRLTRDEILALYDENDLLYLAESARRVKERKSGRKVFYTINRHINLTNVCSANCPLCAFQCRSGDEKSFTLELDDVEKIYRDAENLIDNLINAAKSSTATVIFVSNEVGGGIVPENKLARIFRDIAGLANQKIAANAEKVFLTVAGLAVDLKKII